MKVRLVSRNPQVEATVLDRIALLKRLTARCPMCMGRGVIILERGGWRQAPTLGDCLRCAENLAKARG